MNVAYTSRPRIWIRHVLACIPRRYYFIPESLYKCTCTRVTINQYTFSSVSGGGPQAKRSQAIARMPDRHIDNKNRKTESVSYFIDYLDIFRLKKILKLVTCYSTKCRIGNRE